MDKTIRQWVYSAIDGTISEQDFQRLQDAIEHDDEVRRFYLRAVGLSESLGEIAAESSVSGEAFDRPSVVIPADPTNTKHVGSRGVTRLFPTTRLAIAATLLIVVGGSAFWLGARQRTSLGQPTAEQDSRPRNQADEPQIAGHATLRRAIDLQWPAQASPLREGDVLPNGPFEFGAGIAEIDFFCGATLIVEGPARLNIESDWSVLVSEGRLRASVPPAAQGFVVKAADAEIIDLGTEFAVEVASDRARVQVIDGEVKLKGGLHDGRHLLTGQSESLKGAEDQSSSLEILSTDAELDRRRDQAESERFQAWLNGSRQLRTDERLIAYFPIADSQVDRIVRNQSPRGSSLDGLLIGPVNRTTGRFGAHSSGIEFERPGSRVRTRIDGEFDAFTFACWVRIDSLEHRYNALFMADSYQTGEPHWQIRDDGSMMFSVMVDDTQQIEHFSKYDNRMVKQAGLHRVYYTPPIWDLTKSGHWFHLVTVYDPVNRNVTQYVNGQQVASEEITDKYYISSLRIGPSEIGNWGQPFRKSPWFAVRNLDGVIDELAIFHAALEPDEIRDLYQQGKPVGY